MGAIAEKKTFFPFVVLKINKFIRYNLIYIVHIIKYITFTDVKLLIY